MDNNEIRQLADLMIEKGLTVLEMNTKGESVRLERGTPGTAAAGAKPESVSTPQKQETPVPQIALPAGPILHEIKSPTVGTFYSSSEPGKDPFVTVGSAVSKGDTLCLLEAMKMLNEITADRAGVIAEICSENKHVVEFGQTLFRIDTSAVG